MIEWRRFIGIFLIIASALLTLANSSDPWEHYERELLSGEDVLVQTIEWERSARCIPRFEFYEPAMRVSLFDSGENTLGIMECDDETDCILVISSFAKCLAYSVDDPDDETSQQNVSCTNDLPVDEPMPYDEDETYESGENIKECNDEFTLLLDYEDGSVGEVKYRQLFSHEVFEGYLCNYPY